MDPSHFVPNSTTLEPRYKGPAYTSKPDIFIRVFITRNVVPTFIKVNSFLSKNILFHLILPLYEDGPELKV